jgi:Notch-like protein
VNFSVDFCPGGVIIKNVLYGPVIDILDIINITISYPGGSMIRMWTLCLFALVVFSGSCGAVSVESLVCGDVNNDGTYNIADAVYIINNVFKGGPPPDPNCCAECTEGQTRPCYSGPSGTENVGVCVGGTQTCVNGQWGPCSGEVVPSAEVCDGFDNDCDAVVDNGNPGGGGTCNTGQPGVCAAGTLACQNGVLVCVQNTSPSAEVCDGLDNDCDGAVDNGDPGGGGTCNTGQPGVCASGTLHCQSGALVCVPNNSPSAEVCNGLDDDCDGIVDDGNPGGGGTCTTGLPGVCATGTLECQSGSLVCVPGIQPGEKTEVCNDGLDNDCDGLTDGNDPDCQ